MSQKAVKGTGVCRVCWELFKTHASDGSVHKHGPRKSPCLGSDQLPADTLGQPSANNTVTKVSTTKSSLSASTGNFLLNTASAAVARHTTLSHPVNHCSLIKRIPKAARRTCAQLLATLLKSVIDEPDNTENWSELLQFGRRVLAKPKRGGHKRGLVKIIQDRITSWQSG